MLAGLMLLLVGSGFTSGDYCSLSPQHQLCGPAPLTSPASCGGRGILSTGITADMVETIVGSHNRLRARVARGEERAGRGGGQPGAGDMMELQWDGELARVAQAHADRCHFDHDCRACRAVERWPVVGQNLYIFKQTVRRPAVDWERAVRSWYEEVELFSPRHVKPFRFSEATGHYSQMVWSTTTRVGCGVTVYRTGRWFNVLYTCNYGPGGNYIGAQIYSPGPACSQCPPGSHCSSQHPGLCSHNTRHSQLSKHQQITPSINNNNINIIFNNNNSNNTALCDFETAPPPYCHFRSFTEISYI